MIALLVFIKLYLFIYVLHYYTDDGGGALHYTRLQHTHGDRNKEMKERQSKAKAGKDCTGKENGKKVKVEEERG